MIKYFGFQKCKTSHYRELAGRKLLEKYYIQDPSGFLCKIIWKGKIAPGCIPLEEYEAAENGFIVTDS